MKNVKHNEIPLINRETGKRIPFTITDEFHEIPLRYGKTGKTINIPGMPSDKYGVIGYNSRYGLVDVLEDKGEPFFEGRINIEKLLSGIELEDQEKVDLQVENYIMDAYMNSMDDSYEEDSSLSPKLEILTYES